MLLSGKRILSTGLRFATLLTRFGFVFALAKSVNAADVGYYGLFSATVGYALLCVGLDFYTFTTREILKASLAQRGRMLKGQAALAGVLYLFILPIAIIVIYRGGWPEHLAWWFFPILLLEHLNQELYRLFIVLSEQILASILLFVRQGSWAVVAVLIMYFSPASRNLDVVMVLWGLSGVVAGALGVWKVSQLNLGGWRDAVDWKWVRRGVGVSATFLTATLSLRAIQTVDRYWLQDLAGIKVVGAYVLFFGIANALTVFLDAAVFSFKYPELIVHHNDKNYELSRATVRETFIQTLGFSIVFAFGSYIALPFLLRWIGKPLYIDQIYIYAWVLGAAVSYALGMVPHYGLYARGHDRSIIASHVVALPVFAISTLLLSHLYSTSAVPIGVFISLTFILFCKSILYKKAIRNDDAPRYCRNSK
jgi:O-antigen/teichoic acid export membrane protein